MFRRLKRKLVLINLGITTAVILVTFSAIYIFATRSANNRPPIPEDIVIRNEELTVRDDSVEQIISFTVREEKQAAAKDLLVMLVVSGVAIELAVILVSYLLAEQAIRPVREAYTAQKVFIANASHEIKTPLAAISANLEAADIHNNKWIANVEAETAKLAALNGELLALARTDLVNNVTTESVDVGKLVDGVVKSFEPRMRGINFRYKVTTTGNVKLNAADFTQILGILLDNAIKYCDKKISVVVSGRELVVENDGKTIAARDLPHIFDRFYQVDKSAEGVGLGLSIAKSLAERNRWKLSAESGEGWTKFMVAW